MIKLLPSHPLYEKLEILQLELSHAVNKWPFSAYEFMPDDERERAIEMLLNEIGAEHIALTRSLN